MDQDYDARLDRDGHYGVTGVATTESTESSRPSPRTRGAGPEKTFKACRACRRLKMRCEGPGPCSRCTATGTECIFDRIGTRRRTFNRDDQEKAKRQRREDLEAELRGLRTELTPAATGQMSTITSSGGNVGDYTGGSVASSTPVPPKSNDSQTHNEPSDPYSLTPDDLQAPVTAVHAMIPDSTHTQAEQGFGPGQRRLYPPTLKPQDCVSKEIVSEAQGRRLFNLFMTGSNAFLPILDPVQDTFDSLRTRSPFCFCVILAIAARSEAADEASYNTRQACEVEAKRLGGESLFIGVPRLEDVQAMTLLAAFSERNWFAIGHAMRMAMDLGLPNALPQLLQNHHTVTPQKRRRDKLLARHARTWLTVLHIEWEIACGTARQPRQEQQIDYLNLRAFATHSLSCASDSRILAIIELVQLRGRIQQNIEASDDLAMTAMVRVREAAAEFYSWWTFWDQFQEDSDFPQTSLQRASLILQRDYAAIFTCCAVLGKFQLPTSQKLQGRQGCSLSETTVLEVLSYVTTVIMSLLNFISQSSEYRWNLKWAPTYSGLALAFTTAFALKVCRLRPDVIGCEHMRPIAEEILKILETYPYKNFHRLINLLLTLPPAAPALVHQQDQLGIPEGTSGGGISVQQPERFEAIECHSGPDVRARSPYHSSEVVVLTTNSIPTPMRSQRMENVRSSGNVQYNLDISSFEAAPRTPTGGEAPSWIFDTGSTGAFAFPNQGSCSLFDFDNRLMMDDVVFGSELHHGL